jgi:hypothetical protein
MSWTEERVEAAIERMMQEDPSEVALQFGAFKDIHRRWAWSRNGKVFKIFEDGFEVLNNVIFNTNYLDKSGWPPHRSTQFFLAADSLKRLFRAMEDALDGFCAEAVVLTRSVYETFLRIVFISCFPKDWTTTLFKPEKGQIAFKATNFPRDQLKVDWDFIYKTHSIVSHNLIDTMKRLGQPQTFVGLELQCDEKALNMALNSLTFALWTLFHISRILFFELASDVELTPEAKERIAATDEALEGIIAMMSNSFGRTAQDVLKIGRIVRAAEQGEDWRALA